MKTTFTRLFSKHRGFSSAELVMVVALSAIVIGAMVMSYGTLVRSRSTVAQMVDVSLTSARLTNFYNSTDAKLRDTHAAPAYGSLALAEELREQFYHDVLSATAVFCLPRTGDNTWKPSHISYNPNTDEELDTPQKFRKHIIRVAGVAETLYKDFRNPGAVTGVINEPNASIFILTYTPEVNLLRVQAIYDIDVIRFTTTNQPFGFHASVKRYTDPSLNMTTTNHSLVYNSGYSVFYPPSNLETTVAADFATDGFTPLFVTFERSTRRSLVEGASIDRFKVAAERPFYFIWWPDPAVGHLGPQPNGVEANLPQSSYNQMAGRTSFMFTVPMFPAL